jgi:exopolyphosphatase/guanosine-5'-triphosphate,3'-diphosphate pyrophosphatase
MADTGYPLQVIHGYGIGAEAAIDYLERLSRMTKRQLNSRAGVSKRRTGDITLSSLILSRVLRLGGASGVIFSAFGLREGCLFDRLPAVEQSQDPLLASCREIAGKSRRFPLAAAAVERWVGGFLPDLQARDARLLTAVSMLSDLAWAEHPRYRGEHAFLQVLRLPVVGLNHEDRVFVALAILARYTGHVELSNAASVMRLIPTQRRDLAAVIGLALRLGLTLSGGMARLLADTEVRSRDDRVTIAYPRDMAAVHGDAVGRRVEELANALGKPVVIAPLP